MLKLWILLPFCLKFSNSANAVSKSSQSLAHNDMPSIKIKSQDFRNTQTRKVCLIASLDAVLVVIINEKPYSINVPKHESNLTTDGSYCDTDFKSLLVLGFPFGQLNITFQRDHVKSDPKKVTYCEKCNIGSWTISAFDVRVTNLHKLLETNGTKNNISESSFSASASGDNFDGTVGSLKTGIVIRRSYFCFNLIQVPMTVLDEKNSNKNFLDSLKVRLDLKYIKVQPFLVGDLEKFLDPQFCDMDLMAHFLVILLPFFYFVIFLLVNRYKEKFPCCSKHKKPLSTMALTDETESLKQKPDDIENA